MRAALHEDPVRCPDKATKEDMVERGARDR